MLGEFVAQKSEAAFAELTRRHLPMVFGICRRVLAEDHAAQDATQAVFLTLARKAGTLDREYGLGGWLHHVAVCVARNERQARIRRLRREQEAVAMQPDPIEELSPATDSALRECLDREIDALPAKYRRALVLFHLEKRSLAEVATALRCKDGTVRVWLNRARAKLRSRLVRRGITVSVPALVAWLAAQNDAWAGTVPSELNTATVQHAVGWITGGTAVASVAPNVIALAKGAIQTMFISKIKTAIVVAASVAALTTASALSWQKVNEARDKGLPKTAIEELKPIIVDALQNKQYAEAVKAIGLKIALEGEVEGNLPAEKVTRMEAEIAKAPAEMQPLMEAILAHWYWQYFQQNRWRFMQRTQTAEAPGKDFTTWDLPRILAEIDKHFTAALAHEKLMQATPVAQFDALLNKGTLPDTYRPTLYDFLAFEALEFYNAGEQGAAKAEDEFEITADSPILAAVPEFLKWQPATTDTNSALYKAIGLYQKLIAFHQKDTDQAALFDADLWRLNFGFNHAVGAEKRERYSAALKQFVNDSADSPVSARARYYWAGLLQEDENYVEAHEVAQRGAAAFSKTPEGILCANLVGQIEQKSANITTERIWNTPAATVDVHYRNITKAFFRIVPVDFAEQVKAARWSPEGVDEARVKAILGRVPVAAWNVDLPATADFKERTEKVPVPKDLKPGYYFVFASHTANFEGGKNNPVSYTPVWISDLTVVLRARTDIGGCDGFVLNAVTGEPQAGAEVRTWSRNNNGQFNPGLTGKTDENGLFRFDATVHPEILIAELNGQQIATHNQFAYFGQPGRPVPTTQTIFFTDRSLYRPGQTIAYKGICLSSDTEKNDYHALAGQTLIVMFRDPNGKEIARTQQRCNDYGAFSGSFTAPRDRIAGGMTLHVENGPNGWAQFNVEEYKRPKFQVELAAPKEAAKLNAEVSVTGKATAYTGAAIGGVPVKWRVVREVQFPPWCWWGAFRSGPRNGDSQNIAHGRVVTAADGSFTIQFIARPDLAVPEKDEPKFVYHVMADVTDTTGETRSGDRSLHAGYTALQAKLSAGDWQTADQPVELMVETQTLDDVAQAATGTVKIYQLKQPAQVERASLQGRPFWGFRGAGKNALPKTDPANPDSWELGAVAAEKPFQTDATGLLKLSMPLPAGIYRAELETKDRFGKTVTARLGVQVVDLKSKTFAVKLPEHFAMRKATVEPGETCLALWGTGYDKGRAFVELLHHGKVLRAWWTDADRTQEVFEQPVTEEMRGGFSVCVTYVRENRAYLHDQVVDVPWSNKKLTAKWEHFTSKLAPGKKETWSLVVTGPDAKPAVAEMVAALYDASLDQYLQHNWPSEFNVFRHEISQGLTMFSNNLQNFNQFQGYWNFESRNNPMTYRSFPNELIGYVCFPCAPGGFNGRSGNRLRAAEAKGLAMDGVAFGANMAMAAAVPMDAAKANGIAEAGERQLQFKRKGADRDEQAGSDKLGGGAGAGAGPDLSKVTARKNLNETAFFFPQLRSDETGVVKMEFTMPEALTEWKFMGFAHDRELRSGFITDKAVTSKDLMVEPNPPRFLREGDVIEFTVKVSNQSPTRQTGKVQLTLADARTLRNVDAELANKLGAQEFDLTAKESRTFAWRLTVPDGCDFLTYKAVGATDRLSDGEEGYLPVLSRRILVTESLPLPIRGQQTKKFEFTKLIQSGKSRTLKSENLTVQMVSQPAWYAVLALPYLMEYPHECSEQIFNRLYANALASSIANSDPKIHRVFDLWKATPALDSPLEKNQDLKSVMLEETPWYRQAQDEKQARHNVGVLFDDNRLHDEIARSTQKLAEMQLNNGFWPWFPGASENQYITLYIATGFGRLRHLGVANVELGCIKKAIPALDGWMDKTYHEIQKSKNPDDYVPSASDALYLYGRSFFLQDLPVPAERQAAVDFYLKQARKFWLKVGDRQSEAHLALALHRFGDLTTPLDIMKSIKEHSVSNEELGMFWRDTELSWSWFRAPIETQALMIEAFDEVMNDAQAVEDCKVWLLKQKQTQDWKTTKATADAIYGLLVRGKNLLSSDALVEVDLAGKAITPTDVEPGTGFYEKRFIRAEIKPDMGHITVKKNDAGVSWGSVHWQYLEDMTKVTPYDGTPLKLKKSLFVKETTKQGPVLKPVTGALAVGDELVVRIELRVDRDMEYIHLKDQRGSGTEPVNVLSRYRHQDGLGYYENTRDTASHFFMDYLPKGTYVFEYSTRVQLKGQYQTGIAEVQCMYAPEFNSHSESFTLNVK